MMDRKRRENFYRVQNDVQSLRDTAQNMIMNRINNNTYGSFHDLLDYIVSKSQEYYKTKQEYDGIF